MRHEAVNPGGQALRRAPAHWTLAAGLAVALGAAAALSGAEPPGNGGQEPAKIPATFRDADHLLTVLEDADADIRTLRAPVELVNEFSEIEGSEKQKRRGTLFFSTGHAGGDGAAPQRAFRVDFTQLYLPGEGPGVWVLHDEKKSFVFDGRVLVELIPDRKFAHRRIVAGEEEQVDPLAIGEGPFPIPIGQKKDEILKRFDAELLEPGAGLDGEVPSMLRDTVQLRLAPKPGAEEARDFREVRIWYTRHDADGDGEADFILPRKARTVDTDKSIADVNLATLTVNADLDEGVFDTKIPEGWERQEDDLRRKPEPPRPADGAQ